MKLIPLTDKRPLSGFMWKKDKWSGIIHPEQTSVGILNGPKNGHIGCIDWDRMDALGKHERNINKLGLARIKTFKGEHNYFRMIKPPFNVKVMKTDGLHDGEVRLDDSYQAFISKDKRLPFSNRYKLITPFRLPFITIDDLDFLELEKEPQDLNTNPNTPCITPAVNIDSNDIEAYLPTGPNQNHGLGFLLLRRLKINGNWANKEGIWKEWLSLNKYVLKPASHYVNDFNGHVKYIERHGVTQGLDGVIQGVKEGLKENLEETKDRQFIKGICKKLSSFNLNKEFFLSMNYFWNVDPLKRLTLPYPMHPMRVRRAIDWLIKSGSIEMLEKGKRWSKGQADLFKEGLKSGKATCYKWIGE